MRLLILSCMLIFSSIGSVYTLAATPAIINGIDPSSIDPEMVDVMYLISPRDMKTTAYKGGFPHRFDLKLCKQCLIKSYTLKNNAEFLLNEQPLAIEDLAIQLIKKKFDVIQLGINRSNNTITYLYLGGINELTSGGSNEN